MLSRASLSLDRRSVRVAQRGPDSEAENQDSNRQVVPRSSASHTANAALTHSSHFLNARRAAVAATAMITPTICAFNAGVVACAWDKAQGDTASHRPSTTLPPSSPQRGQFSLNVDIAASFSCCEAAADQGDGARVRLKRKARLSRKAVMPSALPARTCNLSRQPTNALKSTMVDRSISCIARKQGKPGPRQVCLDALSPWPCGPRGCLDAVVVAVPLGMVHGGR